MSAGVCTVGGLVSHNKMLTRRAPISTAVAARPVVVSRSKVLTNRDRQRTPRLHVRANNDNQEPSDLSDTLKADIERMQRLQAAKQQASAGSFQGQAAPPPEGFDIKEAIDKVLIADFFFVLLALAWLAAGVGEQAALNSSVLINAWFPMWQFVFQPAIGVLMLGALASGGIGWLRNKDK